MSQSNNKELVTLRSSSLHFWFPSLYSLVAGPLSLLFFYEAHYLVGTFFALITLLGLRHALNFAFGKPVQVHLYPDKILVNKGYLSGKQEEYKLAELAEVKAYMIDHPRPTIDFNQPLSPDLLQRVAGLMLAEKFGQRTSFYQFYFKKTSYQHFVQALHQRLVPATATAQTQAPASGAPSKLAEALQQCQKYLEKDRQLMASLRQNLREACAPVYRPHYQAHDSEADLLPLHQNPQVLFADEAAPGRYLYYLQNDYRPEASPENRELADKLIATCTQHLHMATQRVETYEQVQQKLLVLKGQEEQAEQLRRVAQSLTGLQETSRQQAEIDRQLRQEADLAEQLARLATDLANSNDLMQAEVLKQYALLLKENFGGS